MSEATANAPANNSRRTWLITSAAMGGAGAAAVAVPFVSSFQPSERAKAAGAAVEFDVSLLQPGEKVVVEWRGKPVWVMRRTPEQLAALEKLDPQLADPTSVRTAYPTPVYAQNRHRSIKPEMLVLVGICTHLGCSPTDRLQPSEGWSGGFYCPCHGSVFDLAGRVFAGMPAPTNLVVPPYKYLNDTRLRIGDDSKGA
jgi:ubiquinol-cytochrome c reductase iron-sulfur subunit